MFKIKEIVLLSLVIMGAQSSPLSVKQAKLENLYTEEEMRTHLAAYNTDVQGLCNAMTEASWNFQTHIGEPEYTTVLNNISIEYANFEKERYEAYIKDVDETEYEDMELRRQIMMLKDIGTSALSDEDLTELNTVQARMEDIYSSAKICPYDKKDNCQPADKTLSLEPEIEEIMSTSEDYMELEYVWEEWRRQTGDLMQSDYLSYVELMNKAAVANGYSDAGTMWRSSYDDDDFMNTIDTLWEQVKPLYDELHTYVRFKLLDIYGDHMNRSSELIPAHLLGNMWGQSWVNLYDRIKPFKDASLIDVTDALKSSYTVEQMFIDSDNFYQSMGLPSSSMSYGPKAVIEKPTDRTITCHASAWDFCNGEDFRIKMCTNLDMEDYVTIHHEMGHIMYYLLYKDQPMLFRTGATPAFHEAVGDTIALSVSTPKHLTKIGLLENYADTEEDNINSLFSMALERVAFLPFGLLIDKWRWQVFNGDIPQEQWNEKWWELRERYQKLSPPVQRSSSNFDPGAKYHVPASSQYIAYFVAHILEFQFYRSLCIEANQFDPANPTANPLHKCDFYESEAAGTKLRNGLSLGASKHWSEAMEALTDSPEISAQPLLDYFAPLYNFLQAENKKNGDMNTVLEEYNEQASKLCNQNSLANWAVQTNIGDASKVEEQNRVSVEYANYKKDQYNSFFKDAVIENYAEESVQRQVKMLKELGTSALSDEDLTQLNTIQRGMELIYNSAKICPYAKKDNCQPADQVLTLEPEIEAIMSTSEDYEELEYVWEEWRRKTGDLMRSDYLSYVGLMNKAANANGYSDAGAMWRSRYEDDDFMNTIDNLWTQVEPLYDELHTYVRYKLLDIYGDHMNKSSELIPAHLLGNMWGQSWVNLYDRIKPFKDASLVDVTEALKSSYTVEKMFIDSDNFYKSMGLPSSSMSYGTKAIIEKPTDRTITCHASAWDFCDGEDFRIKMCTNVDMEDYVTIHHEMGHIMYDLMYKDLPIPFRTGATPAFHEAIGDTIALSVSTPKHLTKIGLLENYADTEEDNINSLFSMALERVAFLPFGLLIDKWRWQVFNGDIPQEQWNEKWWELREKYQKLSPPVQRSSSNFDPGAKYHVPASSQYIAYFVAHILEFQFYRSLCIEANQYDPANPSVNPLHKCDFYENVAAGTKLRNGLSLGASKHWSEAMEALTDSPEISAQPLLDYFAPLYDYLKEENENLRMRAVLEDYNKEAAAMCNKVVKAEWNVATDVTNTDKQNIQLQTVVENSKFVKDNYAAKFANINNPEIYDEDIQRQLKFLSNQGVAVLSEVDLSQRTQVLTRMEGVYNDAKICPFAKQNCNLATEGLTLDPEITEIMASSEDAEELRYVWSEWRNKSGKLMRNDYKDYVRLSNLAATQNGFNDFGAMWRDSYEDANFMQNMDALWNEVKPLYVELHTYVKHQLQELYGDEVGDGANIPAHLLGNMWSQSWINLYDRIKPFKDGSAVDVTSVLLEKNYNPLRMFQEADAFFNRLGLASNAMSYDESKGAVINKPTDRIIACHASAWDFCDGEDYRIKMCTNVNMNDYVTIHHEMGHIQYFIQYASQPLPLRGGANPGFHEAIGDMIALSVSTPQHLQKIGLLTNYADTEADNINALFSMALERVAFLPFGLLIDKWRWQVFNGDIKESEWNAKWWELREQYQMVSSPVERSENDFDPGAKYHIPADSQYIAYFVAHILEFQLHRALCIEAGQYEPSNVNKPLHKCDIDSSLAAGRKLKLGLELGVSKHWKVALEAMTGETELRASALLDYFAPLYAFLKEENENYDTGFGVRVQSSYAVIPGALILCFLWRAIF